MDALELPDVVAAVQGVDAVVYLIHGLDAEDFRRTDREAAENIRVAVDREGVGRVVYLSEIILDIPPGGPGRAPRVPAGGGGGPWPRPRPPR